MSERVQFPIELVLRIAERDRYRCHVCTQPYRWSDPWEIDHFIARSRGGTNHESNLRLSHRSCNREKSNA